MDSHFRWARDNSDSVQQLLDLLKDPFHSEVPYPSPTKTSHAINTRFWLTKQCAPHIDTIVFRLGLVGILSWHHSCRRPPLLLLPPISYRRLRPKIKACRRIARASAVGKRPFRLGDALVEDQGERPHSPCWSRCCHFHALCQHVSQYVFDYGYCWLRHPDPNQLYEFFEYVGRCLLDYETDSRECLE